MASTQFTGLGARMVRRLCVIASLAIGVFAGAGAAEGAPIVYTGCLAGSGSQTACSDGDLTTTTNDWSDALLRWTITGDTLGGPWTYSYTFSYVDTVTGNSPGPVDDTIIEVSPTFTTGDVISVSSNCTTSVGTFDPAAGNSHPNMPSTLYGLKCTAVGDVDPFTWTVTTLRAPVWGDFYARTGGNAANTGTAYNAGFLAADPADAPRNGSVSDHILRPDTATVRQLPEPTTLLLFGSALGLAVRRMRASR
jgi:hypothetical protein